MDTKLVFREVKGPESITLSEKNETIQIELDEWTLKHLLSQGKSTGNVTVITLTWDCLVRRPGYLYMCEIQLQDNCEDMYSKILTGLCDRNYTILRKLTTRFFRQFQTKITRVKYHPLSLELAYFRPEGYGNLGSQLGDIEYVLKSLFSACTQRDLSLSVSLYESNSGDDMNSMESTLSVYGSEVQSSHIPNVTLLEVNTESLTYVLGNEFGMQFEARSSRLSHIERELQTQKEMFTARFTEQESHNENLEMILKSLAGSFKLLLEMEEDRVAEISVDVEQFQRSHHLEEFDTLVNTTYKGARSQEQTDFVDKTEVPPQYDEETEDISETDASAQYLNEHANCISHNITMMGTDSLIPKLTQNYHSQQETSFIEPDMKCELFSSPPDTSNISTTEKISPPSLHAHQLIPQTDRYLPTESGGNKSQFHKPESCLAADPESRVQFSPHSPSTSSSLSVTSDAMQASKQAHQLYSQTETSPGAKTNKTHFEPGSVQYSGLVNKENATDMDVRDMETSLPTSLTTNQERISKANRKDEQSKADTAKKSSQQLPRSSQKQPTVTHGKSPDNSPDQQQLVSSVLQGSTGGKARHFLAVHGVQGTTIGVRRMIETVETAMTEDDNTSPPTNSLSTVLCLDTSDSLGDEGFANMKKAAVDFVDGIDDIAERHEIKENLAVVSCGGKSRIAHHLSNDYSSLRTAVEHLQFGGKSSLFEALLVCLCTIKRRGGPVMLGGIRIQPRIIVMTAGHTFDDIEEPGLDEDTIINNSIDRVLKLVDDFGAEVNQTTFPRPIIWIPFNNTNKRFLEDLSKMKNCRLVECNDVRYLCRYQRDQIIAGTVFDTVKSKLSEQDETEISETEIRAIVRDVARELETTEIDGIIRNVEQRLLNEPSLTRVNPWTMTSDFRNIIEYKDPSLPRLGNRVVRGPDWAGGSEDLQGPGTVINHTEGPGEEKKMIWVLWDNGICQKYRFGYKKAFDLKVVYDQPRTTPSAMVIDIGCEVTRGRDWSSKYNNQDGGAGGAGVVIRKTNYGKVKVRWRRNAHINEYRYGKDNKLDLQIRDPMDCLMACTSQGHGNAEEVELTAEEKVVKDKIPEEKSRWVWQWLSHSEDWQLYSEEMNEKLEKEYHKRKEGSCIVQKNGINYRVLFKSNTEKKIDGSSSTKVQRVCFQNPRSMTEVKYTDAGGMTMTLQNLNGYLLPPHWDPDNWETIHSMKTRPDDVFICSYPKSGFHWMWDVVTMLRRLDTSPVDFQMGSCMLDFHHASKLEQTSPPRVFTSHRYYNDLPRKAREDGCKIVYLLRDPKDISISYYNHMSQVKSIDYQGKAVDFVQMYMHGKVPFKSWWEHVLQWSEVPKQHPDQPLLVIHYEDMKKDPETNVRSIASFLGVKADDALIRAIVDKTSFDAMKKHKESLEVKENKQYKDGRISIFRKGKVGDWKNWLTEEQAKEVLDFFKSKLDTELGLLESAKRYLT